MKNLSIQQFVSGVLVEFNDGEIWKVICNNNYFECILMKPISNVEKYNDIEEYEFSLGYIKTNAVTIIF